jgi:hypothetical protein
MLKNNPLQYKYSQACFGFKSLLLALCLILGLIENAYSQNEYVQRVHQYRDSLNEYFRTHPRSPLDSVDRAVFTSLLYYPVQENFKVPVKFKRTYFGKTFLMKTSTDRLPEYKVYGTLTFEMEGEKQMLTIYQSIALRSKDGYRDYLFCPFKDLTSGETTYGGGRYLDLRKSNLKKGTLDFNLAYNPYCAYNYKYSCPIPPKENHLKVKIEAGVKTLH